MVVGIVVVVGAAEDLSLDLLEMGEGGGGGDEMGEVGWVAEGGRRRRRRRDVVEGGGGERASHDCLERNVFDEMKI